MTTVTAPQTSAMAGTGSAAGSIFSQAQQGGMPGLFGLLMALFSGQNSGVFGDTSQSDLLNGIMTGNGEGTGQMTGNAGQMNALMSLFNPQDAAQLQTLLDGQNLPSDQIKLADLSKLEGLSPLMQKLFSESGSLDELRSSFADLSAAEQDQAVTEMAELLAAAQMMVMPQHAIQGSETLGGGKEPDAQVDALLLADAKAAIGAEQAATQAQQKGIQAAAAAQSAQDKALMDGQQTDMAAQAQALPAAAAAQAHIDAAQKAKSDEAIMQAALVKARHLLGVDQDKAETATATDDAALQDVLAQATQLKEGLISKLQAAQAAQGQQAQSLSVDKAALQQSPAAMMSAPVTTGNNAAQQASSSAVSSAQLMQGNSDKSQGRTDLSMSAIKSDVTASPVQGSVVNTQTAQPAAALAESGFDKLVKDAASGNHLKAEAHQQIRFDRFGTQTPVSQQVGVHLGKAMTDGQSRITIKLVPAELGRIDVRLDVGSDGRVTAHFQVENSSTLSLLQKDAAGIERALTDAGLKTDQQSLNFNLKGDGQRQWGNGQQQAGNSNGQGGHNLAQSQGGQDGTSYDAQAGELELTWYVGPSGVNVRV